MKPGKTGEPRELNFLFFVFGLKLDGQIFLGNVNFVSI